MLRGHQKSKQEYITPEGLRGNINLADVVIGVHAPEFAFKWKRVGSGAQGRADRTGNALDEARTGCAGETAAP